MSELDEVPGNATSKKCPGSITHFLEQLDDDEVKKVTARMHAHRKMGDATAEMSLHRIREIEALREGVAKLEHHINASKLGNPTASAALLKSTIQVDALLQGRVQAEVDLVEERICTEEDKSRMYVHMYGRARKRTIDGARAQINTRHNLGDVEKQLQKVQLELINLRMRVNTGRGELKQCQKELVKHKQVRESRLHEATDALQKDLKWLTDDAVKVAAERERLLEEAAGRVEPQSPQGVPLDESELEKLEAAFARIREATGLSDANDIVNKFLNREQQYTYLIKASSHAQSKIEQLKEEQQELRSNLLQIHGTGMNFVGNRELYNEIDACDARLAKAKQKCEESKSKMLKYRMLLEESRVCTDKIIARLTRTPHETHVSTIHEIAMGLGLVEKHITEILEALRLKQDVGTNEVSGDVDGVGSGGSGLVEKTTSTDANANGKPVPDERCLGASSFHRTSRSSHSRSSLTDAGALRINTESRKQSSKLEPDSPGSPSSPSPRSLRRISVSTHSTTRALSSISSRSPAGEFQQNKWHMPRTPAPMLTKQETSDMMFKV